MFAESRRSCRIISQLTDGFCSTLIVTPLDPSATAICMQKAVDSEYVFPGQFGGHKSIQNNRALEAAFSRAGITDVSSHNLRRTFATRLLSRGAAITGVQHLLGHSSVKTTEKAYAAFVKNERFKQTIDLLDKPVMPRLKVVR